ncbi:T9SS type A sorting domain-containing protein, partial [candidate division KSB1 bacterium]|nr:T9SS type A sorting domain-containing protein [candidate division KSB1 bacterium]
KYEGSYFQYDSLVYIHPYRHLDPRTANLGIEFIRDQGELVYFTANNDYIILDGIDLHYVAYEEIVYCQYAEGVQILNSWILGGRVMLHGPRNRIENCTIENVIIKGADRIWDHKPALPYSALSVGGAGSVAKNNMIKNNWNGGQPASGVPGDPCIWDGNVNKNAPNHLSCHPINRGDHDIIYRNSVFINGQDGIYFDSVHDIVVENCILIWTFAQYLEIPAAKSDSSYNITFRNNIFLCDGFTIQDGCLEGFDSDYNLFFVKSPFQFNVKLGNTSYRSLSDLQAAGYDSNSIVVQNENIFANVPILTDYRDLEIADKIRTDFSPVEGAPQLNAGDPANGTDYPGGRINIGPADLQPDSYTSDVRSPGGEQTEKPEKLTIKQNYPNPFNNSTCVLYSLPEDAHVEIDIYNMTGQHVETLFEGMQRAGEKKIFWNAASVGSGLYFCRISEGMNNEVVKLVLMK